MKIYNIPYKMRKIDSKKQNRRSRSNKSKRTAALPKQTATERNMINSITFDFKTIHGPVAAVMEINELDAAQTIALLDTWGGATAEDRENYRAGAFNLRFFLNDVLATDTVVVLDARDDLTNRPVDVVRHFLHEVKLGEHRGIAPCLEWMDNNDGTFIHGSGAAFALLDGGETEDPATGYPFKLSLPPGVEFSRHDALWVTEELMRLVRPHLSQVRRRPQL